MIVHTLDTISLRQFAKFEKTKQTKYLLRIPAPLFLTDKALVKFFNDFQASFGEGKTDLEREKSKLMAYNKILLAQAILTGFEVISLISLAICFFFYVIHLLCLSLVAARGAFRGRLKGHYHRRHSLAITICEGLYIGSSEKPFARL